MNNSNHTKEKRFIHKPEYPGGKTAMMNFIKEQLQYPKDAMEQKIEGIVRVWYQVDDNGHVVDTKIVQGLFPSCDEEALRIVKLLKYNRPKNMNLRVKSAFHINIHFKLKEAQQKLTLQYTQVSTPPKKEQQNTQNVYTYTINI
jgi:protein TonB